MRQMKMNLDCGPRQILCNKSSYRKPRRMFDSANGGASEGEVETLESFLDCDDTSHPLAGLYRRA